MGSMANKSTMFSKQSLIGERNKILIFLFTLQLCCHCPFTVLYCVKYIKVVKFTSS